MRVATLSYRLCVCALVLMLCSSFQLPVRPPLYGPARLNRYARIPSVPMTSARLSTELQANLLSRFIGVLRANFNYLLRWWEDPEKLISQAVNDMESDLIRVRQSYAEVLAAQRRMERQMEVARSSAEEWYERAERLVQMGNMGAAREAMFKRQTQIDVETALLGQLKAQSATVEKLNVSMTELSMKIAEARRQKEEYLARAKAAKTSLKVHNMLSSVGNSGSDSLSVFNNMKEKIHALESEADVAAEMASVDGTNMQVLEPNGILSAVGTTTTSSNRQGKIDFELQRLEDRLLGKNTAQTLKPKSEIVVDVPYRDIVEKTNN